jgi:hypothetical protein
MGSEESIDKAFKGSEEGLVRHVQLENVKEFIESEPLYSKLEIEPPSSFRLITPDMVLLGCARCERVQPYRQKPKSASGVSRNIGMASNPGEGASLPPPQRMSSGVQFIHLLCTGCNRQEFLCWIEVNAEEKWIRKVGQLPPWTIQLSKELETSLDESVGLYKSALICMSQSYGIGACTYMRRVLEDRLNPLLEIAYQVREEAGAAKEELNEIRRTIEGRTAEDKIKLANQVAPESVAVGGQNPLEKIYDHLSAGLHRRDEQECVKIAMEVRQPLERIFIRLSAPQFTYFGN